MATYRFTYNGQEYCRTSYRHYTHAVLELYKDRVYRVSYCGSAALAQQRARSRTKDRVVVPLEALPAR